MNKITNVTRRDVFEVLVKGFEQDNFFTSYHYQFVFFGKLNPVDFLNRLYPLKNYPSTDSRFTNAEDDIYAHTITNLNDYPVDWLFIDDRFPLKQGKDEDLLQFLCEIFHPEVRNEDIDWRTCYEKLNSLLRQDNYELYPKGQISGRDYFDWRETSVKRLLRISDSEIQSFFQLFNRGGYVLNFSTPSFDKFTKNIVNIALCERYGLSKGKSLEKFVEDGEENDVIKLFKALLQYYETQPEYIKEVSTDIEIKAIYERCKKIVKGLASQTDVIINQIEKLGDEFSSRYIEKQVNLMVSMRKDNPTEAIGKAKELIESCCKTILERRDVTIDKHWKMGQLVDETVKLLKITPNDIPDSIPEASSMKAILGSLKAIASNVANLRNTYGSGHGKSASYKGLEERHAMLAIGSSFTLVRFLWDSFERQSK
ncbi:MAG: abortive infection family protein [Bacteroidaceae bacterium]|jgi:hypothetical protein